MLLVNHELLPVCNMFYCSHYVNFSITSYRLFLVEPISDRRIEGELRSPGVSRDHSGGAGHWRHTLVLVVGLPWWMIFLPVGRCGLDKRLL